MTKKTRKRLLLNRSQPVGVIGNRIREYRVTNNLMQRELAELVGTHQTNISKWEGGGKPDSRSQAKFDELMALIGIDETPREEPPRVAAPVATTTGLRVALSTPEDEFAYSPRKIRHSLDYLVTNLPRLLDKYESTLREIQHLEQSQGITQEQLAILRQKAQNWDDLEEIRARKKW